MKRIDHVLYSRILNTLIGRMYQFRTKYRLTDATMWDLIHIHLYQLETGQGISIFKMTQIRYPGQTVVQAIRDRRERLLKKGLICVSNGKAYLSELGLREISLIGGLELEQVVKSIFISNKDNHRKSTAA